MRSHQGRVPPESLRSIAEPIDWLIELYGHAGSVQYGGEPVSQLEHALQCASLGEAANSTPSLICAALLHDIGHLLHKFGKDPAKRGIDDRHESIGASALATWFPPEVTEPIRLHVDAKRYLCATHTDYYERLTPASQLSLRLQGGVYSPAEAEKFEATPHALQAIILRQWDEHSKIPQLPTPDFAHYVPLLRALL